MTMSSMKSRVTVFVTRVHAEITPRVSSACVSTSKWTKETALPVVKSTVSGARAHMSQGFVHCVDATDHRLADGVESFVAYMDKHPGFSAVLSPSSVLRRLAYRHTEETINKHRS